MKVTLLQASNLDIVDKAISKCFDKQVSEDKKVDRIDRIVNKNGHSSVIKHLIYSFDIDGISKACLMELTRYRIASYSIKSSRCVMPKDLRNTTDEELKDFLIFLKNIGINSANIQQLKLIRKALFALPEVFKTSLIMTINARSLQHFLSLRTNKSALLETRKLAYAIYDVIPEDHKFLFKSYVYKE